MVQQHKYGKLPTFAFRLYEGALTVHDGVRTESGGLMDNVVIYTTPLEKGDFVKIYANSDATPTVTKAEADDDNILGIVVDAPQPGDTSPSGSGAGTTTAQMRKASVELFGVAVRNLKSDGAGAMAAGAQIGFSNATPGFFEAGTPLTAAGIINGICLQYTAATAEKQFPALLGYFGYMPNTA
jgi:hypothetical protein